MFPGHPRQQDYPHHCGFSDRGGCDCGIDYIHRLTGLELYKEETLSRLRDSIYAMSTIK